VLRWAQFVMHDTLRERCGRFNARSWPAQDGRNQGARFTFNYDEQDTAFWGQKGGGWPLASRLFWKGTCVRSNSPKLVTAPVQTRSLGLMNALHAHRARIIRARHPSRAQSGSVAQNADAVLGHSQISRIISWSMVLVTWLCTRRMEDVDDSRGIVRGW
jgi:hypothetical protein